MAEQFLRRIRFVVSDMKGNGLDLSDMALRFRVNNITQSTPNNLSIRIYNLSNQTVNQILGLMPQIIVGQVANGLLELALKNPSGKVVLDAGYAGNFGTIFAGNIVQVKAGRENPTDTYLEITAADGDLAHNWGVVNTTLSAGYKPEDVNQAVHKSFSFDGTQVSKMPADFAQPAAPRGKVLFGMGRDKLHDMATHYGGEWSIYQGRTQWIKFTAYKPGEAIVLNSRSGMIGLPEQTADGIEVRCLLNPAIGPGIRVHIDNKSVQRASFGLDWQNTAWFPPISTDGFYKVLKVDHVGSTRSNEYYSELICLSLDPVMDPESVRNFPYIV